MGSVAMGKVVVTAKIENLGDLYFANSGQLPPDQVRHVEVTDALVDTGASGLSMPKSLIARLGLQPMRVRKAADKCRNHQRAGIQRRPPDHPGAPSASAT